MAVEGPAEATLTTDEGTNRILAFGPASDKNAALLLFLNAIGCYLDKGEVGKAIAMQLAETVKVIYASQVGWRDFQAFTR